jgi:hypothetical protein
MLAFDGILKRLSEVGANSSLSIATTLSGTAVGVSLIVASDPVDLRKLAANPGTRVVLSAILKDAQYAKLSC